jgi:hypothetical protein
MMLRSFMPVVGMLEASSVGWLAWAREGVAARVSATVPLTRAVAQRRTIRGQFSRDTKDS